MRRLLLLALFLLAGSPAMAQQQLKAIASFSILADIVSQVGGDKVQVATLVPAMGDAHVFQPSPSDARAVAGADVLVSNGLNFETWLDRLVAATGFKGRRIVAADGIRPRPLGDHHGHDHGHIHGGHTHDHGHDHGVVDDPHVWHDLRRMQTYVANIAEGLAAADPANAAYYRQRGQAYAAELKALDAWAEAAFTALPRAHRKVITQHDAFGYLADRFEIDFLAPQGIATDAEASAEAVGKLIRQIKRQRVQAVFFENIINPRLIEQIAKDAKVRIGGRLYSDALSPPGGEADSFIKMYRLNVERLIAAMRRDS
ncbi:zinc ABC transporter substrate-binding protein [uncultured Ferrovibrio sp.]|jgi:zinc/manganese transport system substrate-binding protein|uniref:metal ABC transporter solute-binding protein, Zn/Mn family n=1 Tax=uncultured Ferrovibrio sp. TaxID=1576913 RepID=UPI00263775B1|nr:zinc ABC transporter substrate-binding protein [uncultured Ferrovibrio sp.]